MAALDDQIIVDRNNNNRRDGPFAGILQGIGDVIGAGVNTVAQGGNLGDAVGAVNHIF